MATAMATAMAMQKARIRLHPTYHSNGKGTVMHGAFAIYAFQPATSRVRTFIYIARIREC